QIIALHFSLYQECIRIRLLAQPSSLESSVVAIDSAEPSQLGEKQGQARCVVKISAAQDTGNRLMRHQRVPGVSQTQAIFHTHRKMLPDAGLPHSAEFLGFIECRALEGFPRLLQLLYLRLRFDL